MYVMGPIGDKILKQLRAKRIGESWAGSKEKPSFASSWPQSPSSPSSAARRRKCKAPGSRCQRFDPVIWVPSSMASDLEIAKDVKVTARKLLDAAGPEVVPGVGPDDLCFLVDEPTPNGAPLFSQPGKGGHVCTFRLRKDLWDKQLADAGQQGRKVMNSRLDRLQYACNMRLLPELAAWCDQYRSVKVSIAQEKASAAAEQKAMARHRKMEALGPREGEVLLTQVEAEALATQEAEQAAKEADQQVWHESALGAFEAGVQEHAPAAEAKVDTRGPLEAPPAPPTSTLKPTLGKSFSAGSLLAIASRQTLGKHSTAVLKRGNLVFKKAGASLVSSSR
eukprot:TRINITY_DN27590_c0_g1_i1.p1 TRINITY_DN27590_c0_g1~~TRINITY_DN27590_c0_g1_i1.p1  ORF type:complete len:394 (-),score=81.79 TRINITY_DN27590_c0_g1_i1:79-1086(-)